MKPVLVGEQNPYSRDPDHAMLPWPEGASGHRLMLILGMTEREYLRAFDRVDLVKGRWRIKEAREAVSMMQYRRRILLGSKVCQAHGVDFVPFMRLGCSGCYSCRYQGLQHTYDHAVILPHPSGRNRIWDEAGMVERAREAVAWIIGRTPVPIG